MGYPRAYFPYPCSRPVSKVVSVRLLTGSVRFGSVRLVHAVGLNSIIPLETKMEATGTK